MTFQGDGCPPVQPSRGRRVRRKAVAIAVPTGAALGAGAMFAYAAIPNSDGTIGACYVPGGSVRFVDGPSDCRVGQGAESEQFLRFNQIGPAGPQGVAGPAGAPGAPGPRGPGGVGASVYPIPATDYLLEIDGIKGESADKKHKDSIDIESFSWGASQTAVHSSGGGGGAGKVSFQDFHFTKAIDRSTPLLFKRVATGEHIKKAVLFGRKAGGGQQEYLKITLSDVLVSSYKVEPQAPGSGAGPTEEVSLNFAKIEYSYAAQKPDGSLAAPLVATYDLKAAKK